MSDTPRSAPLHIFSLYMSPATANMLRGAMVGGALFIAAIAFIFPMLTGEEDRLVTMIFLAVAAIDLVMAFMLPRFMASRPSPMRLELHADHLAVALGASSEKPLARIPYSDIARAEEWEAIPARDREAGLMGVVLYLDNVRPECARLPYYGTQNGPALTLKGLRSDESPLARFKEVVEKSKAA
jgi:hypothetical protein